MRKVRLTDPSLDAELRTTATNGGSLPALWFFCPICEGHHHAIHYRPEGGQDPQIGNVWTHVSGSTLDDLTLAPSYLARSKRGDLDKTCRLHIFVKNGVMEILSDSGLV